jgi:hypothetical protein
MTRAIRTKYVLTLLMLGYFFELASLQDLSPCQRTPIIPHSCLILEDHQDSLKGEQGVFQCCTENEWDDDTLLGSIGGYLQLNPNLSNQIAFSEYFRYCKKRVFSTGSERGPPEELGYLV